MKKAKKCVIMILTMAMVIGSLNVVMAWYDEGEIYIKSGCTAYCDVWCNTTGASASTHLYVDYTVSSANAYVNLIVDSDGGCYGTVSDSQGLGNDSRALADVEFSGNVTAYYIAVSEHSATVAGEVYSLELKADSY